MECLFSTALGLYTEAARIALEDANNTSVPADKRAIARWLSHVYTVWAAVVADDVDATSIAVPALQSYLSDFLAGMRGSSVEAQWVHGNAPCGLLLANLLTGRVEPELAARCLADLAAYAPSLGHVFVAYSELFNAAVMCANGTDRDQRAGRLIASNLVSTDQTSAVVRRSANLIMARALRADGKAEAALAKYSAAIRPAADCHMINAVARREFETLASAATAHA